MGTNSSNQVHIVFGDSSSVPLYRALDAKAAHETSRMIVIRDYFPFGPLTSFDTTEGRKHRLEWFIETSAVEFPDEPYEPYFDASKDYNENFGEFITAVEQLPKNSSIYVYVGSEPNSQIGLRFLATILRDRENAVYVVTIDEILENLGSKLLGELSTKNVIAIYETLGTLSPLSESQLSVLADDFVRLTTTTSVVRAYVDGSVVDLPEDFCDALILTSVRATQERDNTA